MGTDRQRWPTSPAPQAWPSSIYAAYCNTPTLLRQVWYTTFRGGEEEIQLLDLPEIRTILAEPDLATRFRAHAVAFTPVFRRIGLLLRALQGLATREPAAAALAEFDERRLDAATHYARAAAATGQLAVTEEECRDVLTATMDGAVWHRLVEKRGLV